jgi:DNA-binding transcriptional ArsR family regulator
MTGRDRAAARIVELLDAPLLRALTEPARLEVLRTLLVSGPADVGAIAATLPQHRSVITRHLQTLEAAGVVRGVRDGPPPRLRHRRRRAGRQPRAPARRGARADRGLLPADRPGPRAPPAPPVVIAPRVQRTGSVASRHAAGIASTPPGDARIVMPPTMAALVSRSPTGAAACHTASS